MGKNPSLCFLKANCQLFFILTLKVNAIGKNNVAGNMDED
jgi:hypothetical protein